MQTPNTPLPFVDIMALSRRVVGQIRIEGDNGEPRIIGVKQFDGATFHAQQNIASREDPTTALYAIVQRLLPDATESEVMRLTPEAVEAVIAIASQQIDLVNRYAEAQAEGKGGRSVSRPSKSKRNASRGT